MAIALVGTPFSGGQGSGGGSTSFTSVGINIDAAADFVLVAVTWAQGGSNSRTVTGITLGGQALTQVTSAAAERLNIGTSVGTDLWYMVAPPTGSQTLITTVSAATQSIIHGILSYSGVDQSTPVDGGANTTGNSDPATLAMVSSAGDVIAGIATFENTDTTTISSNNTERWERMETAQEQQTANMADDTTEDATLSWGNSAPRGYAISGAAVKVAGAAAGSILPHMMHMLN